MVWPKEEFTCATFAVESQVPDQPIGSQETQTGAQNRAHECRKSAPQQIFAWDLEGGLEKKLLEGTGCLPGCVF
jgi:non-canonical (house-cleaning) NTP pyrophosphatase